MDAIANSLTFLVDPWFALPWYAIGIAGALWVIFDWMTANTALNPPLKACWPIIVFFFSAVGLALYLITSRPRDIGRYYGREAKMRRFTEYSKPKWRKVVASAAHCVGGDGLGIMTAMVGARLWGFTFWEEFWFEYLIGYLLGWILFQTWAMRLHGNGWLMSLWMGGRAEFFSMITVMLGMALIMRFVTPITVGEQPLPDTYAFWMFGALGLMVGFVLTYPMNWWLVSIGWKHGQGHEFMLDDEDGDEEGGEDEARQEPARGREARA
ncbi:MAG: DUF4396 domain-containing protein [Tranquillimonas sp.]